MIPKYVTSHEFYQFDPYDLFNRKKNADLLQELGSSIVSSQIQKPLVDLITRGDPVFGITDLMLTGLVQMWKADTRKKNRALLIQLIRFHSMNPSVDPEFGLYTLMVLAGLRIGTTTLNWYAQLGNPIRGSVIRTFLRNIPKSIAEGSRYMENVDADFARELNNTCAYYFDELNKTLLAFILMTCHYLKRDPQAYIEKLVDGGYAWLCPTEPNTAAMYDQLAHYRFAQDAGIYSGKTLKSVLTGFADAEPALKRVYASIDPFMSKYYAYAGKHGKGYVEGYRGFEEEEQA